MKLIKISLPGVLIIENEVFKDSRGSLCEVYKDSLFNEKLGFKNVMEIEVESRKGVLRGLHYQLNNTQGKLVSVIIIGLDLSELQTILNNLIISCVSFKFTHLEPLFFHK